MKTSRLGWVCDHLDQRDIPFASVKPKAARLPPVIDLRPGCPPVYDQGQLGSCTGNAIAAAIDYNRRKAGLPFVNPSRLFIYWGERDMEGTVPQDCGAQIRDGIKFVASAGVPHETAWPYVESEFATEPPSNAWTDGLADVVRGYARLNNANLSELKSCLAGGDPFIFGFSVFEAFEGDTVAQTGVVPLPQQEEAPVGGHAVLCVGYSDADGSFMVRNSWGASWGASGYFTLPYAYLTNLNMADDFWTISSTGYGPAQP